jgi:hypothetical protein
MSKEWFYSQVSPYYQGFHREREVCRGWETAAVVLISKEFHDPIAHSGENLFQMRSVLSEPFQWCKQHCKARWEIFGEVGYWWDFESAQDAAMFKLAWGHQQGNISEV